MNAIEHLLANPTSYQLGPAIRLLGMAVASGSPLADGDWERAPVRIRHHLRPSIALHEVIEVHRLSESSFELVTPILNVAGVTGVVPASIWRGCSQNEIEAFERITHRLVANWYETWQRKSDPEEPLVCAFHRSRSAAGLEAMLASALQLPVCAKESVGGWAYATDDCGNHRLAYDANKYCELTVGPVGRITFDRLMPGKDLLHQLCRLARTYAGPEIQFRINVTLQYRDVRTAIRGIDRYGRGSVIGEPTGDVVVSFIERDLLV